MEAKLAREKAAIKSGGLLDYFKPKCSRPTSSSGGGVANVSDVAVVSNFDDAQSPVSEDVNLGSSGDGVANVSHVGAVNIFGDHSHFSVKILAWDYLLLLVEALMLIV